MGPTPSRRSTSAPGGCSHSPASLRAPAAWHSIRTTRAPCWAKARAVTHPAGPAPTTATSEQVGMARTSLFGDKHPRHSDRGEQMGETGNGGCSVSPTGAGFNKRGLDFGIPRRARPNSALSFKQDLCQQSRLFRGRRSDLLRAAPLLRYRRTAHGPFAPATPAAFSVVPARCSVTEPRRVTAHAEYEYCEPVQDGSRASAARSWCARGGPTPHSTG